MHFTRTVDLVVVIEGDEVVLDTERTTLRQGDFIVQNGTRHEWLNHTDMPAKRGMVSRRRTRERAEGVGVAGA